MLLTPPRMSISRYYMHHNDSCIEKVDNRMQEKVIGSNGKDELVNNLSDKNIEADLKAYPISNGPCKQIHTAEANELSIYHVVDSYLIKKGYCLQCLNTPCLWTKHSEFCKDRDNNLRQKTKIDQLKNE